MQEKWFTDFRETLLRPLQRCVHNDKTITLLRKKGDFKLIFLSNDK